MSSLAVLTTVLNELTVSARAQSDEGDKAVRVTWILTRLRSGVVHLIAPRAVFSHSEHVDDCDDWLALKDGLPHICAQNRVHRNQLPLSPSLNRLVEVGRCKLLTQFLTRVEFLHPNLVAKSSLEFGLRAFTIES